MQFQMVLAMSDDEPRKMEEIRRFSAIYGRFDCKRKPEKPLTLHEASYIYLYAHLNNYFDFHVYLSIRPSGSVRPSETNFNSCKRITICH